MTVNEIVVRVTEIALTDYSPKRANTRTRIRQFALILDFNEFTSYLYFFLLSFFNMINNIIINNTLFFFSTLKT